MSIIFLFVDGVGLGRISQNNPFYKADWKSYRYMSDGQPFSDEAKAVIKENLLFKPMDARLGVEGLPQSGTGQATLFSGENASKEIGKHFGPFPHSGNKHLLRKESLFKKAQQKGKQPQFINAYPDIFFEKAREKQRWSCTTLMTKSAGIPLNTVKEVQEEKAITAGLTQRAWREHLHLKVPQITPEEAAQRLLEQAKNFDLLLHEYYLTDKAGHSQQPEEAATVLSQYDRFLWELMEDKPSQTTIVLSSDHGNIEDLSTKTHTLNKVPLFVYGPGVDAFAGAKSIKDITPGILTLL